MGGVVLGGEHAEALAERRRRSAREQMLRDVGPRRRVLVVGAHLDAPFAEHGVLAVGIRVLLRLRRLLLRPVVGDRRCRVLLQVLPREVERSRVEVAELVPHVKPSRPASKPRLDARLPVLLGDANELLDDEGDRLRVVHAGLELVLVSNPAANLRVDVLAQA